MQQVYMQNGKTFAPADPESLNIVERLPVGTYTVGVSPAGFFLTRVDDMELPSKLYGGVGKTAARILKTWNDRPAGTGVLLNGTKGAGKTMLTKLLSRDAGAQYDAITLLVNQPFCGEAFNTFIQGIDQPAVILYDEFEKVYDQDDQARLLTILDGTRPSKKLHLLTVNERGRVNNYMLNRPGRLYYALEFKGLDREFITEYCADELDNQDHAMGVVVVSQFFYEFTFDMLKALVEEMNRYGESATDAMKMLNMKPLDSGGGAYIVSLVVDGKEMLFSGPDSVLQGSPLTRNGYGLDFYPVRKGGDHDDDEATIEDGSIKSHLKVTLLSTKLKHFDMEKDLFVFGAEQENIELRFRRRVIEPVVFDYDRMARTAAPFRTSLD